MANESQLRVRYGEALWRAHHEAWQRTAWNQRRYCEAHGIPLKAFGQVHGRTTTGGAKASVPGAEA